MRTHVILACVIALAGCSHKSNTGGGNDMSIHGDGGMTASCVPPAGACTTDAMCCVGTCDATTKTCVVGNTTGGLNDMGLPSGNVIGCLAQGQACTSSVQCCGLNCTSGKCGALCTQNGNACTANGDCCSANCSSGKCAAIANPNSTCVTDNNACTTNADCCTSNCKGGVCIITATGCQPLNDICFQASDCCSGVCTKAAGASAGYCGALQTMGNCNKDGEVCTGCTSCCSRVCAGTATGANVCQLAEGCRIQGDTCTKNADCCGATGSGLPGDGTVRCEMVANTNPPIGFCTNPMAGGGGNSCDPEGDVCDPMPRLTCGGNARENCCACGGQGVPPYNCCKLDKEGVPRCYGGYSTQCPTGYTGQAPCCIAAGSQCTFSSECCNGAPCLPDSNGVLKCGTMCSQSGQVCTSNSDCCAGLACNVVNGSTTGTCGTAPPPPKTTGDMGTPTPVGDGGTCSLVGQSCSATQPCCPGSNCANATGQPCAASDTGCTCFGVIL